MNWFGFPFTTFCLPRRFMKRGGAINQKENQLNTPVGRVTFTTSRELEFFTETELTTPVGYRKDLWPLVMVKELIDNAVDACETAATGAIKLGVQLDKDSLTVSDNGPGISHKVVKGVLDY